MPPYPGSWPPPPPPRRRPRPPRGAGRERRPRRAGRPPRRRGAARSGGRLVKEGGAAAVKLEGGRRMRAAIRAVVDAGIPVIGHVGLTPQSVHQFGGFKVQRDAEQLLADAAAVEEAGAFALVVE